MSYSYTLNGSETHSSGDGANLGEHFTVVAGDSNGDSATGTLDINITDDVPKAVDDEQGTASETLLTLNGNVLSNDVQGADRVPVGENTGPITPGTFTGTYGTLVLNANGTYTYTLNTSDADFKALARRWQRHRNLHLHPDRCRWRHQHRQPGAADPQQR